jgi:hypothetical protein
MFVVITEGVFVYVSVLMSICDFCHFYFNGQLLALFSVVSKDNFQRLTAIFVVSILIYNAYLLPEKKSIHG